MALSICLLFLVLLYNKIYNKIYIKYFMSEEIHTIEHVDTTDLFSDLCFIILRHVNSEETNKF
jgi:hypothetical protein